MPSGAKKRKAAKKKKEKGTNTNLQGNDELKSQDEKGSDGGEGGSPSYHDHDDDHNHPFNEGNEDVEESDNSAAQPSAADAKSVEEVSSDIKIDEGVRGKQGGDGVVIERDLKSGEIFDSKDVSDVHVEYAKESDYRNGNSSGGLSDITVTENAKDEPNNSVKEAVAFDELVKSIDSSHAKMTSITENAPVGETGNSVLESPVDPVKAVASISEVKSSDSGSALPEKSVASQVGPIDLAMKKNEDKVHPFSDGAEHVNDSDTPECSENQPLVTSAPHVVRKTSWLNCCGLFEVLTGSDR